MFSPKDPADLDLWNNSAKNIVTNNKALQKKYLFEIKKSAVISTL